MLCFRLVTRRAAGAESLQDLVGELGALGVKSAFAISRGSGSDRWTRDVRRGLERGKWIRGFWSKVVLVQHFFGGRRLGEQRDTWLSAPSGPFTSARGRRDRISVGPNTPLCGTPLQFGGNNAFIQPPDAGPLWFDFRPDLTDLG